MIMLLGLNDGDELHYEIMLLELRDVDEDGDALSCCALPCFAFPCLSVPCLALLCLVVPCLALPCLALRIRVIL